jgi:hypothetical protein
MSAYLASNDAISALTTYWEMSAMRGNYTTPAEQLVRAHLAASARSGKGWNHYQAIDDAQSLIHSHGTPATAVFALLVAENVRSLQFRYPGNPDMYSAADLYRFRPSGSVKRWMRFAPHGEGNLVGIARSYAYQSCECDDWKCSIAFQIIEQIRDFLLEDLKRRDCKDEHIGASFEEPKSSASTPQLLTAVFSADA